MDILLNTNKEVGFFSRFTSKLDLKKESENNSVFDAFDFFMESAISNSAKINTNDIDYLLYDEDDDIDLDEDDDEDDDWDEEEGDWDDEEWEEEFEWDEEGEWDEEDWDDEEDEWDDDDEDDDWDDEPEAKMFSLKDFTIN